MELDPTEVNQVARRWDEQHHELTVAGQQIGGAATAGFSAAVAASAQQFAREWGRTATSMGETCEQRADSMRTSVQLALDADDASAQGLSGLAAAVADRR